MKNFLPKDNRGFDLKRRDGFTIDPKTSLKSGQSQPSRLRTPEQVDGWARYGVTRDADRSGSTDDAHDKQFTWGNEPQDDDNYHGTSFHSTPTSIVATGVEGNTSTRYQAQPDRQPATLRNMVSGKLPLAVTFFVWGVAINAALFGISYALRTYQWTTFFELFYFLEKQYGELGPIWLFTGFDLLRVVYALLSFIGIWKSGENFAGNKQMVVLSRLAVIGAGMYAIKFIQRLLEYTFKLLSYYGSIF